MTTTSQVRSTAANGPIDDSRAGYGRDTGAVVREIRTVLVANRGEIACRVIATLRRMGLRSVAIYTDPDAHARHVREADVAVHLGSFASGSDSPINPGSGNYLDIASVVRAAQATGADAVHPGYGFLSENQQFAEALAQAGIAFVGPPVTAIATMGDKIAARAAVTERTVPVVPGLSRPGLTDADLIAAAPEIGFPVLIKPSAGGGGKGMHRVADPADLPDALARARREANAAFGDDALFVEHFVDTPRHIEVQVLADNHGNIIHLGERECSLQRRHQKVIEEAPSALLDSATRERIGRAACDAARSVGYTGAGTVEFIVSAHRPDEFFFMEMNTRLQVEHPVTEMVTGIDLVEQQIRVARGEVLAIAQEDVVLVGHAIEARVYAEDPARGFLPTGGEIVALVEPDTTAGHGVRVDSAMLPGLVVGSDYDPMLAKVIAHGSDRGEAIERLAHALSETRVLGVVTNIDFCRYVLARPEVLQARLDTELLDRLAVDYVSPEPVPEALALVGLARVGNRRADDVWDSAVGFRLGAHAPVVSRLTAGPHKRTVSAQIRVADERWVSADVTITAPPADADDADDVGADDVRADGAPQPWSARVEYLAAQATTSGRSARLVVNGISQQWSLAEIGDQWWVSGPDGTWIVELTRSVLGADASEAAGTIVSPMPGTIVAVSAQSGDCVAAGAPIVVVEAMKMEHTLTAPIDGVATVSVSLGEKVAAGAQLAHIDPPVPDETS